MFAILDGCLHGELLRLARLRKVVQASWSVIESIVDPTSRQYIPVKDVVDLQKTPGRRQCNPDQYCPRKCLSASNVRGIHG